MIPEIGALRYTNLMRFLLTATFKSNKLKEDVVSWVRDVTPHAPSSLSLVVAPSFPHLSLVSSPLVLAAQDVSPFPPGSYTGAVNADQLKDFGVTYCLVGHSERRKYFHETPVEIANKVDLLLGVGITPILCLSKSDLAPQLSALTCNILSPIYCYEPPADIGGTDTAPLEDIVGTVGEFKKIIGEQARVMYGGSVNAGNAVPLIPHVSGLLVSTACLNLKSFIDIINVCSTYSQNGSKS